MTISVLGELSLFAVLPLVTAAMAPAIANVEAEVAALANFSVTPPSLELDLAVSAQVTAGLALNLSLGVSPPTLDAQLAVVLAALATLKIELDLLNGLKSTLGASAHLYEYEGTVGDFGGELDAELASGLPGGTALDVAFGVVLVATAPAAISALKSLFATP